MFVDSVTFVDPVTYRMEGWLVVQVAVKAGGVVA